MPCCTRSRAAGSSSPPTGGCAGTRPPFAEFVADGGRYLGFCLGGYLAGATPGFGLLPGDTDQYIATRGATIASTGDTLVQVRWRGRRRQLYFQDGPTFVVEPGAMGVTVLARYPNGENAALVAAFGAGAVGVVGPHPEATPDWYRDTGLVKSDGLDTDLGHDLIEAVMSHCSVRIPLPRRSSP